MYGVRACRFLVLRQEEKKEASAQWPGHPPGLACWWGHTLPGAAVLLRSVAGRPARARPADQLIPNTTYQAPDLPRPKAAEVGGGGTRQRAPAKKRETEARSRGPTSCLPEAAVAGQRGCLASFFYWRGRPPPRGAHACPPSAEAASSASKIVHAVSSGLRDRAKTSEACVQLESERASMRCAHPSKARRRGPRPQEPGLRDTISNSCLASHDTDATPTLRP